MFHIRDGQLISQLCQLVHHGQGLPVMGFDAIHQDRQCLVYLFRILFPFRLIQFHQEEMSFCSINMVKFLMDEGVQFFFEFIYPDMLNTWKGKLTKASALLDAETEIGELLKETDRKERYTGFQQRKSVLP